MRLLLGCVALFFTTVANAQPVSNEMKTDITTMLRITGALEIGEQMGNVISQQIITAMTTQNPDMPAGDADQIIQIVRENINNFINSDESVAGLVNIYASHYTHDDILDLIEFYESPLGKKLLLEGPQIALESAQFGQSLFLQHVPQIQKDIQQSLQAAGLQPPAQPQP